MLEYSDNVAPFLAPPMSVFRIVLFTLIPIAPIRLVLTLVLMVMMWLHALVLPSRMFVQVVRPLSRAILFVQGYMYIKFKNKMTVSLHARKIVFNHIGTADALLALWCSSGVFVAKKEILKTPILGSIAKAAGFILVDRDEEKGAGSEGKHSKSKVIQAISNRTLTDVPVIIFPSATTSLPTHPIEFKVGAFLDLLPVRPFVMIMDAYLTLGAKCSQFAVLYYSFCHVWHNVKIVQMDDVPAPAPLEGASKRDTIDRFRESVQRSMGSAIREETGACKFYPNTLKKAVAEIRGSKETDPPCKV